MANPQHQGLKRLWHATRYSMAGFRAAWQNEAAFRQECGMALVLVPLGLWLGSSPVEKALLVSTVILVLIVELLNSAVEAVVDRVSTDHHDLSGRAKDMGSAAVLLSLLILGATWSATLWQRFF